MEKVIEREYLLKILGNSVIIDKNTDQLYFWSTSTPIYENGYYTMRYAIIRVDWVRYLLMRNRKEDIFYLYAINLKDIISVKYDPVTIFSKVIVGKLFVKKDDNEIWRTINSR